MHSLTPCQRNPKRTDQSQEGPFFCRLEIVLVSFAYYGFRNREVFCSLYAFSCFLFPLSLANADTVGFRGLQSNKTSKLIWVNDTPCLSMHSNLLTRDVSRFALRSIPQILKLGLRKRATHSQLTLTQQLLKPSHVFRTIDFDYFEGTSSRGDETWT
ncbi:hypothetical protein K439DRAFT_1172156 [Ramaria rubella]|nr:hypothetical protein K439DRAFT_1172156 [Ramaria rubella]